MRITIDIEEHQEAAGPRLQVNATADPRKATPREQAMAYQLMGAVKVVLQSSSRECKSITMVERNPLPGGAG